MKRTIQILLLCLVATTVMAQSTTTRRLHITTNPKGLFLINLQVYPTAELNSYDRFIGNPIITMKSDTTGIDVQVPVGAGIYMSIELSGYNAGNGNFNPGDMNNYVIESWKDNGETVTLRQSRYNFLWVMPDHDADLVGTFVYDPGVPGQGEQPMMGGWDPETGTLINDAESDNPSGVSSVDRSKVLRYIRVGSYWGASKKTLSFSPSSYPNCSFFDASRTDAPSVSCRYSGSQSCSLTDVVLPATVTSIESYHFRDVPLQTLTLYALTPPSMGFTDCPDMVVRVPAEVVPIYKAHAQWGRFTIVPIDGDYVNLSVQLMATPDSATIARYKNMYLDLTNIESGTTRTMLVNSRNVYDFRYLPTNTAYHAVLRTDKGSEIAHIDNIYIGKDNKTVTFGPLKTPHTLEVTLTANGQPVGEEMYSNTWYTTDGEFIARGTTLSSVLDGEQVRYSLDIDQSLAMQYMVPAAADITVGQQADHIVLPLQLIAEKEVSFLVTDSLTHQGIANATITVSQLFGHGDRGTTVTLTTGGDGRASGRMLAVASAVTVNSPMHGAQSFAVNLAEADTPISIAFVQATGTTIYLSHTFQAAVAEGQEPTVQSGYDDGRNLEYTFNVTLPDGRDSVITRFLVNYPLVTLYNDLPKGTKVRVQATSANDAIEPVTAEATVGDGKTVQVTLPIVERGYIRASYTRTESGKPAVLIFNAAGELVKRMPFYDMESKTTTITGLPTGSYLVAAMSQGVQYANISSRKQLEMYEADKDYVSQQVSVADGHIAKVNFFRVPLATTQLESNLSERRAHWGSSEVTVGYTAGIAVKVAFQGLKERIHGSNYDESLYPTDCRLEVYVPEGFTQPTAWRSYRSYTYRQLGSYAYTQTGTIDAIKNMKDIMIFKSDIYMTAATSQWNEAERKLTVYWPHIDEGGKMNLSMVPTLSNTFRPEIYLCYTLNGKPYREMLETNNLPVSRSTINVPELVVTPTFKVRGKGMYLEETANGAPSAGSPKKAALSASDFRGTGGILNPEKYKFYEVTVMDGNSEIGKAEINSSGEWSATCTLPHATSLSKHSIWAKIAYRNGVSYQTEAKQVTFDPNGVVPYTVKMSFFNHNPVHLENTEVLFDLQTQEAKPTSYGYDIREGYNTDFTFEINLSTNDTTKVYAVDLAIFTKGPDAESFIIPAHYNARKNRWIAYWKFNTRSLPYNVNVRPYYHHEIIASRQEADDAFSFFRNALTLDANVEQLQSQADALLSQLQAAVTAGDEAAAETLDRQLMAIYNEMLNYCGMTIDIIDVDETQEAAINQEIDELLKQKTYFEQAIDGNLKELNQLGNIIEGITTQSATGMTEQSLKADGYNSCLMDDGSILFIRTNNDGSMNLVSLKDNFMVTYNAQARARMNVMKAGNGGIEALEAGLAEFFDKVGELNNLVSEISNYADMALNVLNTYLKELCSKQNEIINLINKTSAVDPKKLSWLEKAAMNSSRYIRLKAIAAKSTLASKARNIFQQFKVGDGLGTLGGLVSLVNDAREMGAKIKRCKSLYYSIPDPCEDDQFKANQLRADALSLGDWALGYSMTKISSDITSIAGSVAGFVGCTTVVAAPEGLIGVAASVALMGLTKIGDEYFQMRYDEEFCDIVVEKNSLVCNKSKKKGDEEEEKECNTDCGDEDGGGSGGKIGGGGGMSGGTSGSTGILDPSGFVYEGVESNRLEGVTTTVFYKEMMKNIFGEDEEKVTLWDAENYAQVNPQLTDENGEYGWMVPSGLWQVKYEKDGYQTEYSEWLPVPPPQLDVNQGMIQMSQPVVSDVKATTQAVTVTFDKYMQADTLNARHIFVTRGGQKVSGTIEPVLPTSDTDALLRLANRVRFLPTTPLPAGQKLMLTVKGDVKSYAGMEMGSDYQQEFDIKAVVERIVADTAINVFYDQGYALTLQALPAAAAAGKKVSARILSDMIATTNVTELTLDAQGKASLIITGEAHGTTALILQMVDDPEVELVVTVTVKEEGDFVCPMPKTNYLPNQSYPAGTQIELTCSLPGATILYTTDGSCPCSDENDVQVYTGPITLMADIVIKAVARAAGYEESDVAEFSFQLFDPSGVREVSDRLPAKVKGTYTFFGVKVTDTKHLQPGIYIRDGRKIVVK